VRFYTGIPARTDDPRWHQFWSSKLAVMGRQGVHVYSRPLRYRTKTVRLPNGMVLTFMAGEEKGVDVRIALDVIRLAHRDEYDVAVLFSQDQDLSEVAEEVKYSFEATWKAAQRFLAVVEGVEAGSSEIGHPCRPRGGIAAVSSGRAGPRDDR
jgi:hypothetical protein